MVLEQFTLPQSPIVPFLTSLSSQLASVQDNSTPIKKNLFQSVGFGIDTVLQSAIAGTPSADECPLARIFYDPNRLTYDDVQGVALFVILPIEVYILFALDYPSLTFQSLRESFVRQVLDYLKYPLFASDNYRGMSIDGSWKWMHSEVPVQHDVTSIRNLGTTIQITPTGNYSLSKLTLQAMVKNYTA